MIDLIKLVNQYQHKDLLDYINSNRMQKIIREGNYLLFVYLYLLIKEEPGRLKDLQEILDTAFLYGSSEVALFALKEGANFSN